MTPPRHFLDLDRLDAAELRRILDLGAAYKARRANGRPATGKFLAMVFDKPSTRTRVSFEVAMKELGGDVIVLDQGGSQIGRGETMADTARVMSRYVDVIMIRTGRSADLEEMAEYSDVPVINGLTDKSHPCQLMADIMTIEERTGPVKGKIVAWSGDGNNVANSWIQAAVRFNFTLRIACPRALRPPKPLLDWAAREGGQVSVTDDANAAMDGADCVVTDTWVSMGHDNAEKRHNLLAPFRVDERLMAKAKPSAIFLHCLPAKRGLEATAGVIDGPQSAIWDEAENRLHAQKGILAWCLG